MALTITTVRRYNENSLEALLDRLIDQARLDGHESETACLRENILEAVEDMLESARNGVS